MEEEKIRQTSVMTLLLIIIEIFAAQNRISMYERNKILFDVCVCETRKRKIIP